ncbi:MAG: aminotransferase class I/II-fold pyridoxal phosphate-dependent enzyme, partial [Candidatus Neomarinimicrobiota bacterium]
SKLNVNAESCSNHFIQHAMVDAMQADQSGSKQILSTLKKRRDTAVDGLNNISGISLAKPNSTFYLFPNVTKVMESKGFSSIEQLQIGALENSGVSFCTRNHFGRPSPAENEYFIRFAYSGIGVSDIRESLHKLKLYFEN